MLYNDIKISKVQKVIYSSLDLMNKPVRQLLFTKLCNSLNRIEFTIVKQFKGAGICLLNHGISLNRDSINQDLSVPTM